MLKWFLLSSPSKHFDLQDVFIIEMISLFDFGKTPTVGRRDQENQLEVVVSCSTATDASPPCITPLYDGTWPLLPWRVASVSLGGLSVPPLPMEWGRNNRV